MKSMFRTSTSLLAAAAIVLVVLCSAVAPAAATPHGDTSTPAPTTTPDSSDDDDDGNPIINIDVGGIVDAIKNLGGSLVDKITSAIFAPFEAFAKAVIDVLTHLFTSYPTIQPNEDIRELHRLSLIVTFALSTLTIVIAGILFQVGPLFGVSYQQVRLILPRVLLALVFSTVSPYLLQYTVEFASALTMAFKPTDPGFWEASRLLGGLVLVSLLDAFILAAIGAMFVIRDIYLLFAAVASPLIALGWALPYTRQYANSLIGVYWSFLLIGPMDMIVFRLTLELLETSGGEVPHWLTAMGGFVMLLGIPYILLTTGQSMAIELGGMAMNADPRRVSGRFNKMNRYNNWKKQKQQRRLRREQGTFSDFRNSDDGNNRGSTGSKTVNDDNKFSDMLPEEYKE